MAGREAALQGGFCIFRNPFLDREFENKHLYRRLQPVLWRPAQNPYRWLNLEMLCQLLLPKNTIEQIKYFTAPVSASPNDPDQPARQQLYLRALRMLPKVSIHFGHFLTHEVTMALVVPPGQPTRYARVIKTEEKGSDVNLATHLLHDAHMGKFDVAVVVSNDSDLLEPIKIVREQLRKRIGILNPHPSRVLLPHIDFIKQIRAGVLRASQFPATLTDAHGTLPSLRRGDCHFNGALPRP